MRTLISGALCLSIFFVTTSSHSAQIEEEYNFQEVQTPLGHHILNISDTSSNQALPTNTELSHESQISVIDTRAVWATKIGLQSAVLASSIAAIFYIDDYRNSLVDFVAATDATSPCFFEANCNLDLAWNDAWSFLPEFTNLGITGIGALRIGLYTARALGPENLKRFTKKPIFYSALGMTAFAWTTAFFLYDFDRQRTDGFPQQVKDDLFDARNVAIVTFGLSVATLLMDTAISTKEFSDINAYGPRYDRTFDRLKTLLDREHID